MGDAGAVVCAGGGRVVGSLVDTNGASGADRAAGTVAREGSEAGLDGAENGGAGRWKPAKNLFSWTIYSSTRTCKRKKRQSIHVDMYCAIAHFEVETSKTSFLDGQWYKHTTFYHEPSRHDVKVNLI